MRLCAAGCLAYCSYAICRTPLLPLLARDLGADPPLVGLVVGASTLTGIVLKLPAGAWSDVLGRRTLLVAGALTFATVPFVYLSVSGLRLLIAVRFLHGGATALFGPVASASLSDLAPAHRRATWLSTYSTAQGAGQAIGPVLAGYLITFGRFDMAFILAGLIGLSTPLIVARWPIERHDGARPRPWRQFAEGIKEVVGERRILLTSVAQAAQFVLNGTLNAFLPLYARDVAELSAADVGWLFGLQIVTTLAIRPVIGMASDRLGRRGIIFAGLVICSTAVWMISIAWTFRGLLPAVLIYGAGVAVTTAATGAYITDIAGRARYGAAHGVFGTIYDVGDAAGPILAGLLVSVWGYTSMFRSMALAAIIIAFTFYFLSGSPEREAPR